MRNIIVLIAILVSFGSIAQETISKSRIGLAGSTYLNFDEKFKSNSQYVEGSYDYLVHPRVRIGLSVDYNLTSKKESDAIIGMDSTRTTEYSRSGLGAQAYMDYIFVKKERFDIYVKAGFGINVPVNVVTTETNYYQGNQISEDEFNTLFNAWKNPMRYTLGVGAEYKIKEYLAVGLEINYRSFGLNPVNTRGVGAKLGVFYKF